MQTKTIGLLGGIGWASTAEYYRIINESIVAREGDGHSARIVLHSMDQHDFTSRAGDPQAIVPFLAAQVARLKEGGADFFLFCANGAHRFVPALLPLVDLPFVSIVDATAARVQASGLRKVGLLGVKQTMAGSFYHERLAAHGIETITPSPAEQDEVHDIIYRELVHNRITDASRGRFVGIIGRLALDGAQGCILGCTEIPLLVGQGDVAIPVFDTTRIHCEAAVALALDKHR
ncbi:aspartate/glutamate racemase family protein [Massilia sp. YMA4]|uniref:aspartate/glutamate racemase family protein n=1 Tax=Massilia sp. YMA4 TaxID=1593482 RepID=UPI000DD15696|nr:amino acid racemase [Massilia sp. YMA4]AXA94418.1 aspartate/glutamate racemase [Massilia sp. YMA4]